MKRTVFPSHSFKCTLFTLLLSAFASGVFAQATLSIQGVLTKSDGTAVDDGTYNITFRLFDQPSGGNQVHSETISVETIGGVYSVILGSNTPLTAPFNTIYYLSVLAGSSELLPRPQLTHAPYALSLLGQNNKFPSTGTVIADAYTALGGAPLGVQAQRGYAFGPGGDSDGGLFSSGDNNVALYANGTKTLEGNNGGITIPGSLSVGNGASITGNQTVSGTTTSGSQTVNGNEFVSGSSRSNGKFLTTLEGPGGGYSFVDDAGNDSGMFAYGDGHFALKANGLNRVEIGNNLNFDNTPGSVYMRAGNDVVFDIGGSHNYYMNNMKAKTGGGNFKTIQININNGVVQYDNSSRRYKRNIRPLEDDFSLILKSQPRVYNRLTDTVYWELGYIAEEMDSIGLHNLVQHDANGVIDGFDYDKMILYAVEVLKIQDAAIRDLKAEIAALKTENEGLRTENSTLRTDNNNIQTQQTAIEKQLELLAKRMNSLENTRVENNRK